MNGFVTDVTVYCADMVRDDWADFEERGDDPTHQTVRTATVIRDRDGNTRCSYCGELVKVAG